MKLFLETLVTIYGEVLDEDHDYIVVEAVQFDRNFGPFAEGEHVDRLQVIRLRNKVWLEELVDTGEEKWIPKWDAYCVKMNSDDKRIHYPPESVKRANEIQESWVNQEDVQKALNDSYKLSEIEGFIDSPLLCVLDSVDMKPGLFDKLDHWFQTAGDPNAVPKQTRFVPDAVVKNGEGFRIRGDKYQVYNVTTGEILMQGDCIEL